jgi:hypothetical protein
MASLINKPIEQGEIHSKYKLSSLHHIALDTVNSTVYITHMINLASEISSLNLIDFSSPHRFNPMQKKRQNGSENICINDKIGDLFFYRHLQFFLILFQLY